LRERAEIHSAAGGVGGRNLDAIHCDYGKFVLQSTQDDFIGFTARAEQRDAWQTADGFSRIGIGQFLDLFLRDHIDDGFGADLLVDGRHLANGLCLDRHRAPADDGRRERHI